MPITAYSNEAARELDLEQWLTLNQYPIAADPQLERMPEALRDKAAHDIECTGCRARGAMLVAVGRQRGVGRSVSQGHFRFGATGATNPHDPLCDFYFDEKAPRDTDYLVNFASDRAVLTRVVRDLVCRGIRAKRFDQADIRRMRLWFLAERTAHAMPLAVSPELLDWCVEMDALRGAAGMPFQPQHAQLPGFDWNTAARVEWRRRNVALFEGRPFRVWFQGDEANQRARRLIELGDRATVLDPTALREKYEAVIRLADFAALSVYHLAKAKPPQLPYAQFAGLKSAGRALLALCALLLFIEDWDIAKASASYADLTAMPAATDGLEGNVMGLNPFHDYRAWQVLHEARRIESIRTDARPVAAQLETVRAELQALHLDWLARSATTGGPP